ncbi:MAG: C25 family cysteine peptidase [candidate division WOR-3 bacterium]
MSVPACGMHYNGGPLYSDHWYACVAGTDTVADVPLGRFPLDTEAAVKQAANKVVKYERDPPADWQLRRVLLVNHWQFSGAGQNFADLLDRLGVPYHRQAGEDSSVTNQTLKGHIEGSGGYGILSYYGHGEIPGKWWQWNRWTQDFTMSDVAGLANTEWLPLVYNIACHCAQFDPPSNQCAVWLGGSTGGVAAWGFAREASALEAGQLDRRLIETPYRMRVPETGVVSMAARLMMLNQYPGSDRASTNNRLFHLMGDPTLNVWARDSGQLTVQVSPGSMVAGSSARRVDVWVRRSDGTPLPGAAVGFFKEGEPHILGSVQTDANGHAWKSLAPLLPGAIQVTAFKPLHRTGKGRVIVDPENAAPDGEQGEYADSPAEFAVRAAPVQRDARIWVSVPRATRLHLTLFDVAGRTLAAAAGVDLAPGGHWLDLLAPHSAAKTLAPGTYFVRYRSGLGGGLLKFTMVR